MTRRAHAMSRFDLRPGWCIVNDLAVAARAAQRDAGVRQVLFVDLDVHQARAVCPNPHPHPNPYPNPTPEPYPRPDPDRFSSSPLSLSAYVSGRGALHSSRQCSCSRYTLTA